MAKEEETVLSKNQSLKEYVHKLAKADKEQSKCKTSNFF